jgi:hypothetical protein
MDDGIKTIAYWKKQIKSTILGGTGGIRTPDKPLQAYNGLANRRLQPLGHRSSAGGLPCFGGDVKRGAWVVAKLPQVAVRQAAVCPKWLAAWGLPHHNKSMKVLAWPLGAPWWRLLACLLVALAALALLPEAFAQNTSFPYLGPDPQKAMSAYTIFGLQYKLFLAPLANVGAVEGLYYLSLLATMIGALLIVFNSKFRTLSTLGPWLILVVIMLFAPFNSRLLFYPVERPTGFNYVRTENYLTPGGALSAPVVAPVSQCSVDKPCGFTPQLLGIHVASILQVAFANLFTSSEWRGLVSNMRAEARARQDPALNVGESWMLMFDRYQTRCGVDALVGNTNAPPIVNPQAEAPTTMREAWSSLATLYSPDVVTDIPPVMKLPNEQTVQNTWGRPEQETIRRNYLLGIKSLFKASTGINISGNVVLGEVSPGSNNIRLNDALRGIANSIVFRTANFAMPPIFVLPGFFIEPEAPITSSPNREELRRCYAVNMGNAVGEEIRRRDLNCVAAAFRGRGDAIMFYPETHRENFQALQNALDVNTPFVPRSLQNAAWERFITEYRANPELQEMPIINTAFNVPQINNAAVPRLTNPTQQGSCSDEANNLYQTMINNMRNNLRQREVGNAVDFLDNLNGWLIGTNPVPANITASGAQNDEQTGGISTRAYQQSSRASAMNIFLSSYLQDLLLAKARDKGAAQNPPVQSFTPANLSAAERRSVVALGMLEVVRQATSSNRQRSEAERAATSNVDPSLVGFGAEGAARAARGEGSASPITQPSWVAWFFNGLATLLGSLAIWVVSWFYGLFALAYWDFLQMFMDMAFMGLLVLTPFLFLAGLIIPSNAPGVIMISILGVFILKFTAVSMVLLNALGMLMYNLMDAGAIADSWVTKATLVIAMSGLYTGIIGFSLYLMFKVGDASMFVSKLAGLDDAAKEAAKTGVTAATAVVASAVGILGSGAVGAFATKAGAMAAMKKTAGGLVKDTAVKAGFGAAVNTYQGRDGPDGATEPGGPGGPGSPTGPGGKPFTPEQKREFERREAAAGGDDFEFMGKTYKNYEGIGYKTEEDFNRGFESGAIGRKQDGSFYEPVSGMISRDSMIHQQLKDGGFDVSYDGKLVDFNGKRYEVSNNGGLVSYRQIANGKYADGLTAVPEDMDLAAQQNVLNQMEKDPGQRFFKVGDQWYEAVPGEAGKFSFVKADQLAVDTARANGTDQFTAAQTPTATPPSGAAGTPSLAAPAIESGSAAAQGASTEAQQQPAKQPDVKPNVGTITQEQARQKVLDQRADEQRMNYARRDIENDEKIQELETKKSLRGGKLDASDDAELNRRIAFRNASANADLIGTKQSEFNKSKEIDALWKAIEDKGFEQPGFLAGGWSGLVGGTRAFMGGASSIPVVGDILKELVNEATEAPERARAWQVSGGWRQASKLQKDAARATAFKKELSATTGGYEYRDMMSSGSFQAQHDIAKSAAAQAVARQRSEWEALMYANGNQAFTVEQMQGIGRGDALMKVQSLRVEAADMQPGKTFTTKVLDVKGNIVDQEVSLSVGVLNDFAETAAWKGSAKKLGDALTQQYGTIEKRYFRGPDSGWAKADRLKGDARIREFARLDMDTDYLQYGHINMVEGKWNHMAAKGKYDAYKTLRLNEMIDVERHATTNIASLIASVNDTAEKKGTPNLKIPVGLSFAEIAKDPSQKAAIMAEATKAMQKANIALPLSDFHIKAERVGFREVMQKSMRNQYQLAILGSDIQEGLLKDAVKLGNSILKIDSRVKKKTRGYDALNRPIDIDEGIGTILDTFYETQLDILSKGDRRLRGDDKVMMEATREMNKFYKEFLEIGRTKNFDLVQISAQDQNGFFVQQANADVMIKALEKYKEQAKQSDSAMEALERSYKIDERVKREAASNPTGAVVDVSDKWKHRGKKNP